MTVAPKSPRLISAVLLVLTLAAGFAIGMAWPSDAEPPPEEGEAPGSRDGDRGRRALVIHEVGLDPEVRAQVDEIISHFGRRMQALDREFREAYRPRQRALIGQARDSIRSILTPRQVVVYDSLLALRYDGRGRDGGRSPRGGGRSRDDGRSRDNGRGGR